MGALEEYIRKALQDGYSKDAIIKVLRQERIPKSQITAAFTQVEQPFPVKYALELFGGMCLLAVLFFLLNTLLTAPIDCNSLECFIDRANQCGEATIEQEEFGSIVRYHTQSCVLTKSFAKLAENEPEQVVQLFTSRNMRCVYQRNNFDQALLQLNGKLETCTGTLKDAILALQN